MWTCTRIYDDILFEYPLDSFALSMSYLTGLITAQKDLMRNIPARVVAEYSKSDRFYGTVNGKLCFGYEECNQFEEAERTGAIALSRDHLISFRSTGHGPLFLDRTVCLTLFAMWPSFGYFSTVI